MAPTSVGADEAEEVDEPAVGLDGGGAAGDGGRAASGVGHGGEAGGTVGATGGGGAMTTAWAICKSLTLSTTMPIANESSAVEAPPSRLP